MDRTPGEILRENFVERIARNDSYSLRAFARDLEISPAFLSQILNGRRKPSLRQAIRLSAKLEFDEFERNDFLRSLANIQEESAKASVQRVGKRQPDVLTLELDRFRLVSDWYHGVILELMRTPDFRPSGGWIAKKIGISASEAGSAIKRLARLGLIRTEDRRWERTQSHVFFPTRHADVATKKFHRAMIGKAMDSLSSSEQRDYEARDISGITMAIDPKRLGIAKKKIAVFRKQMSALLSKGETSEVYQLNVQLFSLRSPTPPILKRKERRGRR